MGKVNDEGINILFKGLYAVQMGYMLFRRVLYCCSGGYMKLRKVLCCLEGLYMDVQEVLHFRLKFTCDT